MNTRPLSTLIHALITFSLFIPTINAESLVDVYTLAKSKDTDVQEADANYNAALQAHPIARASLLPQVELTAETTDNSLETVGQTFGVGSADVDFNSHSYTLRLTQALYNQTFFSQLRQSKNTIARARIELDSTKQDLLIRTSESYFDVLAAEDNLRFATAEKNAIQRQLEQAEKRFDVGLASITDVKEAQSSFDLAVADEINAEIELEIARDSLAVITGERIDAFAPLSDRAEYVRPDPNDVHEWIDKALNQNLNVLISEYDTVIAAQEVKIDRSQHYPSVDIVASHNDADTGGITGSRDVEDTRIGIELTVPIFSGGRVYYQAKESEFLHLAALQAHERIKRQTIQTTRDAYHNVVAGISRVRAFERAVESARIAAEATEAGFEVGTRTSIDVLLALRTIFEAERDFARSRYDYLLDTLRLKQASGSLSPDDLVQIDGWLE